MTVNLKIISNRVRWDCEGKDKIYIESVWLKKIQ